MALAPGRRQAIIWTNVGILSIRPLGTNLSEILFKIDIFSLNKMHLKRSPAKWCGYFVSAFMCYNLQVYFVARKIISAWLGLIYELVVLEYTPGKCMCRQFWAWACVMTQYQLLKQWTVSSDTQSSISKDLLTNYPCPFPHNLSLFNHVRLTKSSVLLSTSIRWRHQMETFSALLALCAGISPHKGQWRGALMFSLVCAWINGWVNNRKAGDLRGHRAHYDVTVMYYPWNKLDVT